LQNDVGIDAPLSPLVKCSQGKFDDVKKFFFDDVREAPDADWVLAQDVWQAKQALRTFAFDVMSLDHDIGMQMMCARCREEIPKPITNARVEEKLRLGCTHTEHGTDLAMWMTHNLLRWPKLIILHSSNPYGAARMKSILGPYANIEVIPYDQCKYKSFVNSDLAYWIVIGCAMVGTIAGFILARTQ
jgi:NAD+-processing family protein with receiver domain